MASQNRRSLNQNLLNERVVDYGSILSPNPNTVNVENSYITNQSDFFCEICFETFPISFQFNLENSSNYMDIKDGVIKINYPNGKGYQLTSSEIESALNSHPDQVSLLQRYKNLKIGRENPNYRECSRGKTGKLYGPSRRRYITFSQQEIEITNIVCDNCQHHFCFIHGDAHVGQTCQDYSNRNALTERASIQIINTMSKRCPRCDAATEKNGG
eukprot:gene19698-27885_t